MADHGSVDNHAPATQGLVVEVFQMLSKKVEDSHTSLRQSLTSFADRMEARMLAHDREDRLVADRVLIIETNLERSIDEMAAEKERTKAELDRRMVVIGLLVSVGMMVIGHFWK